MLNKITTVGLIVLTVYIANGKQHCGKSFFLGSGRCAMSFIELIVNKMFSIFGLETVLSIRCYQCSTQTDPKGVDSCGAYKKFNSSQHIAIECNSDESHMPGSFCKKVVQQGPRGFICK